MTTADDPALAAAALAVEEPDAEEQARQRRRRTQEIARWLLPALVLVIAIGGWHLLVELRDIPHYILPGPTRVAETLVTDFGMFAASWWITFQVTILALLLAVTVGTGLAILFTQSRLLELAFFPYAVVLQVTPVVAIAPLILIYVDDMLMRLLIIAWIVAFFPILSNTTLGLKSADHNLHDLFRIYGATRWQKLRYLQLPSALPYFLGGLRIAGGLALIGTVVAEFVIGTGGRGAGLAYRILESGYRLQIPRLFAALVMIMLTGVAIYLVITWITHLALHKWHESAIRRET